MKTTLLALFALVLVGCDTMPDALAPPGNDDQQYKSLSLLSDTLTASTCLEPGRYTALTLMGEGTETEPLELRPCQSSVNPTWKQTPLERVVVNGLNIEGAYWRISGLTVEDTTSTLIGFSIESHHITLDSLFVRAKRPLFPGPEPRALIRFLGQYHNLTNSVLTNPVFIPMQDVNCMDMGNAQYVHIINNEVFDCAGDGIKFTNAQDPLDRTKQGALLENNVWYLTKAMYSDCNGNPNGIGPCACAENAIDMSITTNDPAAEDRTYIRGNVIYGYRETDTLCSGSLKVQRGAALSMHWETLGMVTVENNVFFDNAGGMRILGIGPGVEVRNNLIVDSTSPAIEVVDVEAGDLVIHNNTTLTSNPYMKARVLIEGLEVTNNLFMEGGMPQITMDATSTMGANGYVNTTPYTVNMPDSANVELTGRDGDWEDVCVQTSMHRRPRTRCLLNVIPDPAIVELDGIGYRQ